MRDARRWTDSQLAKGFFLGPEAETKEERRLVRKLGNAISDSLLYMPRCGAALNPSFRRSNRVSLSRLDFFILVRLFPIVHRPSLGWSRLGTDLTPSW